MNWASSAIQHVVRLTVKKSTCSREQTMNIGESVIRRRFVPDSFQLLIRGRIAKAEQAAVSSAEHSAFASRLKSLCVACHSRQHRRAPDNQRQKALFPSR